MSDKINALDFFGKIYQSEIKRREVKVRRIEISISRLKFDSLYFDNAKQLMRERKGLILQIELFREALRGATPDSPEEIN